MRRLTTWLAPKGIRPRCGALGVAVAAGLHVLGALAAADTEAPKVSLEGTFWRLVEFNGQAVGADGETVPHLVFHRETSRVAGFGGCNRFLASCTLTIDGLSITPIGGGRAQCPETVARERNFIAALANVAGYELEDTGLRLATGREIVLVFEAVANKSSGVR
jgi:putative lipoprotein